MDGCFSISVSKSNTQKRELFELMYFVSCFEKKSHVNDFKFFHSKQEKEETIC